MLSKLLNNSFGANALKKFTAIVSGLIFLILMTRYLGPELRGRYAYILNAVSIIATICNLGLSLVIANYVKEKHTYGKDVFISLSIYQFIFYLGISVVSYAISQDVDMFLICFLSAITIFALQINNISLVYDIKVNSVGNVISSIVNLILICLIYIMTNKNFYLIIAVYTVKELSIALIILRLIGFHLIKWNNEWFNIIKKGFLPMLTTGLIALNYKIDIVLLEWFDIEYILIGLFATGVALAEYSWLIPDIFKEVLLNRNSRKDDTEIMNMSIRFAFSVVVLCALFFALFGKFLLSKVFGSAFADAYPITLLMFLAVPFMIFVKLVGTLFIANGKWKLYFKILVITSLINVASNIILIKFMGIFGAAVASILSYSFCGLYCLNWYAKTYGFSKYKLFFVHKDDIYFIKNYFTRN